MEIKIGQCFTVQAGVSDTLPVSVLLGRDVPELLPLVSTGEDVPGGGTDDVLVVTTWARAKKQTQEAALERELTSGAASGEPGGGWKGRGCDSREGVCRRYFRPGEREDQDDKETKANK